MTEIDNYLEYYKRLPHLFRYNENINIIVDETELKEYANRKNCKLGVVFENNYFSLVVDLIENSSGRRYTYARIVSRNEYNGVVIIPILKGKIVFLKQFRHGTREYEIELPRGFSEKSKTIQDNAESEIYEELGVSTTRMEHLGSVINDTGLSGGLVHIFMCEIENIGKLSADEGIKETMQLSLLETEDLIKENRIRDCFTLSAIYKLKISKNR
jgi:8-oxo-dGTP pyrophosphatase MutT (NUDIX family)